MIPFNSDIKLWFDNLITIKYNSDNKYLNFYINWKLDNSINIDLKNSMNNLNDVSIWWDYLRQNFWFNWTIDEVKIYNRVLSDEEILSQAKSAWF